MKERPILFSGPMVRAILAGTKTQTRRVVKPQTAILTDATARSIGIQPPARENPPVIPCPYGAPGDLLWVRETHAIVPASAYRCSREEDGSPVPHRVSPDGEEWAVYRAGWSRSDPHRWRPSIHMPRWASRLTLRVTDVRVERLQAISEADARAEGVASVAEYAALWDAINGAGSWAANPWVWAIGFEVVR